jgi:hypothetical protein
MEKNSLSYFLKINNFEIFPRLSVVFLNTDYLIWQPMDGSAEGLDIQLLSDLHLEINVDSSYLSDPTPEQQVTSSSQLCVFLRDKEEILKNLLDDQRHPQFEVKAPYLALLGDIGYPWTWVYKTFLGQQAARFETVTTSWEERTTRFYYK